MSWNIVFEDENKVENIIDGRCESIDVMEPLSTPLLIPNISRGALIVMVPWRMSFAITDPLCVGDSANDCNAP
jgi:hypothetical protein